MKHIKRAAAWFTLIRLDLIRFQLIWLPTGSDDVGVVQQVAAEASFSNDFKNMFSNIFL